MVQASAPPAGDERAAGDLPCDRPARPQGGDALPISPVDDVAGGVSAAPGTSWTRPRQALKPVGYSFHPMALEPRRGLVLKSEGPRAWMRPRRGAASRRRRAREHAPHVSGEPMTITGAEGVVLRPPQVPSTTIAPKRCVGRPRAHRCRHLRVGDTDSASAAVGKIVAAALLPSVSHTRTCAYVLPSTTTSGSPARCDRRPSLWLRSSAWRASLRTRPLGSHSRYGLEPRPLRWHSGPWIGNACSGCRGRQAIDAKRGRREWNSGIGICSFEICGPAG